MRGELVGLAGRLDGPALGQSFGALPDCLVDWLVGFLVWVGCLVNGSIGYWIHSSVVWWDSGSLRLSAILWSVGRLVGQSVVRIVRGSFGWWIGGLFGRAVKSCAWSVGLSHGQWMDWLDG